MTTLGRIITGESATMAGRQAVLNVIMNRAEANYGEFGKTWIQQATAHAQFSAYPDHLGPESAETEAMIQAAINKELGNIVPLSFNYANPNIMNRAETPNSWVWTALASGAGVEIGGNTFWANSQGGSPGYDPSKLWKGPTMVDTPTASAPQPGSYQAIAGEAASVVDEISNLEPIIATAINFIPGGSVVAPMVNSFAPLLLSTASRALHDIASNNGGDVFAALIELMQHLKPGQPNSATLSKS